MKPKIITEPNVSVLHFVLLHIATVAVYPFIWYSLNLDKLNEVVQGKLLKVQNVIVLAALSGWFQVALAKSAAGYDESLQASYSTVALGLLIAIPIYQYFRIVKPVVDGLDKVLLRDCQIDLRPNRFFAFVFGPLYIVYVINKVPQMMVRFSLMAASASGAGQGNPPAVDR